MSGTFLNPPKFCDICHRGIGDEFSDAKMPSGGQWANACKGCAKAYHMTYGTGRGQRYVKDEAGVFRKVEG